jgi:SAM-dependent methyltransferase
MSNEDRERWEERHRRDMTTLAPRPSVAGLPVAAAGAVALDLACGQGRHVRVLRSLGYHVVAMDVARAALLRVREVSGGDAGIFPVEADADDWPFATDSFDAVVQVDFLERRLFDKLDAALRPGGLLLVDTFLDQGRPNAEGPGRTDFLLQPGELRARFAGYTVLRDDETRGETGRGVFLARKH